MTAYYNEIDPYAAQWLRNLITAGHIAPGEVDERDIRDVLPSDLNGYTQCHFFAGIGVWSYALRRARWPDDRPVWTGSCPCQPFSAAGAGAGTADERHLWPHWDHLISVCQPEVIFGEQVEAAINHGWFDLVQADLEGKSYAVWPVGFPAAGVGAPHIRARGWFVADRPSERWEWGRVGEPSGRFGSPQLERFCDAVQLADLRGDGRAQAGPGESATGGDGTVGDGTARGLDHHHQGSQGYAGDGDGGRGRAGTAGSVAEAGLSGGIPDTARGGRGEECPVCGGSRPGDRTEGRTAGHCCCCPGGVVDDGGERRERGQGLPSGRVNDGQDAGRIEGDDGLVSADQAGVQRDYRPGPTNGPWGDADWLLCRDGKWRPVEPCTFPLAHGAPARVGRLRAYGNAIVAEAAEALIATYLEAENDGFAPLDAVGGVIEATVQRERVVPGLTGWATPDAAAMNVFADPVKHQQRRDRLKIKHGNGNGAGLPLGQMAHLADFSGDPLAGLLG